MRETARKVGHEIVGGRHRAVAKAERDDQLRVGIERRPRPAIAPAGGLLFVAGVLLLRADERPNFITLETARTDATNLFVLIFRAGCAELDEQLHDGVLGDSCHADRCPDGIPLNECPDDLRSFSAVQSVHCQSPS